jgi:uncharacterized protein (TIRG00374 family)
VGDSTRASGLLTGGGVRRVAVGAVQLAVSAGFLFLTLRRVDPVQVWRGAERVDIWILSASLLSKLAGLGFMTLRTRLLSRHLANIRAGTILKSILVAFVGNNVLPFRLGELLRVLYLRSRSSLPTSAGFALVFLERVLDLQALTLLAIACLPLLLLRGATVPALVAFLAAVVGTTLGVLAAGRHPQRLVAALRLLARPLGPVAQGWLGERAATFTRGLAGFQSLAVAAGAAASTVGLWTTSALSMQFWIWAFGLRLPWYAPLVMLVYVSAGVLLPAAPGFVGTYHFFLQAALASFGVDRETATAFAFVGHFTAVVPFTVAAVPFVLQDLRRLRRLPDAAAVSAAASGG